jgi:hypothetical protein
MRMTVTSSAILNFGRQAGAACSFLLLFLFAVPAIALDRCAAYGPDFTSVEGTGACVKISGHVRVEVGAHGLNRVGDNGYVQDGAPAPAAMRTEETVNGDAGDPADFPYSHHLRLRQDSDPAYSGWYVR